MVSKFNKLLIISISLWGVLLFGCEDVIDINLNNTEPKTVIEGTITDKQGPYFVKIHKSADYFDFSSFTPVVDAVVKITDNEGNSEILKEKENGIYTTQSLKGIPGRTYTLDVKSEGKNYSAVSEMPEPLNIDSLKSKFFEGLFGVTGYKILCYFQDRKDKNDFCRVKLYQNGEMHDYYFLYNDRLTDGETIDYTIFNDEFEKNDEIIIELLTLNRATYEFYSTFRLVTASEGEGEGNTSGQAPANPTTNLTNGALGYFGTFTVRKDTIIIK